MRWCLILGATCLLGCWRVSQPLDVAHSAPGRTGFAAAEHQRGFTVGLAGAQSRQWAVAVAAVSDPTGRRVGVWRVIEGGTLLEYCTTRACRIIEVESSGLGFGPLAIVEPAARGRYTGQTEVQAMNSPPVVTAYGPDGVRPGLPGQEVHAPSLVEDDGAALPRDARSPDLPPSRRLLGAAAGLSGQPGTAHHGVWVLRGDTLVHCIGWADRAACRPVGEADQVLGAMVVRRGAAMVDVVWIERGDAVWRCAGRADAARCVGARMVEEVE